MPPAKSGKFKTSRFPAARIKRIMQLDEEVGKLASATPVMISKSLECFIQVLLDESCKEVTASGSRKLTAGHLKSMINTNPNFDFLREIVDAVPELPEGGKSSAAGPSRARKPSASAAATKAAKAAKAEKKEAEEEEEIGSGIAGGTAKKSRAKKEVEDDVKPQVAEPAVPSWSGAPVPAAQPANPLIGSWKKDMTGGGGTGEGGRGMFDDYEEDDDDY
ncbi:hypothetical protein L198_05605 [Cryptococcus wingfieldii CBS 7118]|uniref:Transcription factor CBF/NF-Y/archaeal histone domain-containing protein n=2 Tax=Cryptococcus TaxID=5206 RepID=A0A1E3IW40_9TREE|nr:hypothetical protein L198_05605 [Cryptococcus wingfieldii CBS 7118]ODN92809.1 hypothetical protein L198_05605 [Cryptococcus wingfieldii CBS 7118]TYJ52770.1 hypothetical protein B9479_006621 [Cryptococcus floricola]